MSSYDYEDIPVKFHKDDKLTREVILDARKLIEVNGFCQGTYRNASNKFCVIGAIKEASGIKFVSSYEAYSRRKDACEIVLGIIRRRTSYTSIVDFADAPKTSKADAIAVLQDAANSVGT